MKCMNQTLKTIWLVYSRKVANWILTVFAAVVVSVVPLFVPEGSDFISLLDRALSVNVIVFATMAFLAYELISQMIDDPDMEALKAIPTVRIKTAICCYIALNVILIGISIFELVGILLRAKILNLISRQLIFHILKVVLLYAYLPGLVGIGAGGAFSDSSRGSAYLLVVLFAVLFSPSVTNILPEGPVGMLTRLDEWLRILPSGTGTANDPIYGIPLESSRFALVLFWLMFFMLFRFLRKEMHQDCYGIICLILSTILLFVFGIRFFLRTNDSIFDSVSNHGMIYEDAVFYEKWKEPERNAVFAVQSYDLKLDIGDYLKAEARIKLSDKNRNQSQYEFTLSHGLRVSSVKNEEGVSIPFSQNGDWFDLFPEYEIDEFTVIYSGHVARHYTNWQCVFFSGYVAYYPIPGHLSLWNYTENCLEPLSWLPSVEFTIQVDSRLTIVSNLKTIGNNIFQGSTSSPMLLGGLISKRMDGELEVYYPALQYESIEYQKQQLEASYSEMSSLLHLSSSTMNRLDTVFVLAPLTSYNSSKEECVFNEEYMTHANRYQTVYYDLVTRSLVLGKIKEDGSIQFRQLLRLLSRALGEEYLPEKTEEKPDYDKLIAMIQYDISGVSNPEALRIAQMAFSELFYYQLTELGRETFLPLVYEYLLCSHRTLQPVDYLYQMNG